MDATPFHVKATVHFCTTCGYASTKKSRVKIHQTRKCTGAGMRSQKMTLVPEVGCSTTSTVDNSTVDNVTVDNITVNNSTVNITVNSTVNVQAPKEEVIPAESYKETQVIVDLLKKNLSVLRHILSSNMDMALATLLRHTNGSQGPPNLKNIDVDTRYVTETRERDKVKMSMHKYTAHKLVCFLQLLENIAYSCVPKDDIEMQKRADEVLHGLQGKTVTTRKKTRLSMLELAELYRDNNEEFQRVVLPEDRRRILDCVKALKDELKDMRPTV